MNGKNGMNQTWPISIRKSDLSQEESDAIFNRAYYTSLVRTNQQSMLRDMREMVGRLDFAFLEHLSKICRVNGAINIQDLLTSSHSSFFDIPERLSRPWTHSRGYTYLISGDFGLTAAEKLVVYRKDLFDALRCVKDTSSKLERFVISDYIKNAVITMFNALVSEEKIGNFCLEDESYQRTRSELQDLFLEATQFHYQFLFMDPTFALSDGYEERSERAVCYLQDKSAKRWSRLHGASVSRPEASHPLVIFCAALRLASKYPAVATIIGLPSGGTELAMLCDMHYRRMYGRSPHTVLLPVSLHSSKEVFGKEELDAGGIGAFLQLHANQFLGGDTLICDDNSSTGRTLQCAHDILKPFVGSGNVWCAVAEIDIVRTFIDRDNVNRKYIANPVIYNHSINILPVSKKKRPKRDIKELMERPEIIKHHTRHRQAAADEVEAIYREIMIDANTFDTTEIVETTPREFLIDSIQGTALSNFYAIPIRYEGAVYPSVEHAYQHRKFAPAMLASVDNDTMEQIREAMRRRGFGARIDDLNALFCDDRFNSGNIKIVADILRGHGYGKKSWAKARVRTMISLLLIKFSDHKMMEALRATGDRIIIEGNDWSDTLWGYYNRRGRNLLGRILMNIRDRNHWQLGKAV